MTSLIKRTLPARMHFWNESDIEETTFLLYMWVMELLPTRKFGEHIRDYKRREPESDIIWDAATREVFSEARSTLFSSFSSTRLKLATFKAIVKRVVNKQEAECLFASEGLPRDCADLYMYLLRDKHFWEVMRSKLKTFSVPLLMQDIVLDPDLLISQCNEDFKQYKVDKCIKYEVWSHIRFIAESNNESIDSLEQEVRMNAVSYYYKVRPFRNRLYATNYAKSSVGGRVQQLITYYTDPERARLREETGSMKNQGNSVIVSTGNPELLASFENVFSHKPTWADLAMSG